MKEIKLTQGKVALVDDEDYDYLMQWKWHYNNGYAARTKKKIKMHRVINNTPDGADTDHINRNKLDNRKINLRTATRTQNEGNRDKQKNNTSGFKGVYWHKKIGKWQASLSGKPKQIHLGYHDTKEAAAIAYNEAAKAYFGEFALLNKIEVTQCA